MIPKDQVLGAFVRIFFKYFTTAITEDGDQSPQSVKQMMLEHYEQVSQVFNQEALYAFARMNYTYEEILPLMQEKARQNANPMQLVRAVCRTDAFYDTMVSEYTRHFMFLLSGRIATSEEAAQYTRCPELGEIEAGVAEEIIDRMAQNAYREAQKLKQDGRATTPEDTATTQE